MTKINATGHPFPVMCAAAKSFSIERAIDINALSANTSSSIENRTFDEIEVDGHVSLVRTPNQRDVELFAATSGTANPAHMVPACARGDMFHRVTVHGMRGGALAPTARPFVVES